MPLSKKQLAKRNSALFASEIVALFPEYAPSYARNILEVYAEKTGVGSLREHSNANTDVGNFLEKPIAELWARDRRAAGEIIKLQKVRESRVVDVSGIALGATPDFLLQPPRRMEALECKYVHPIAASEWDEDAPYHVLLQCAMQRLVWQVEAVHIAAWIGSAATREARIYEPNHDLEKLIIDRCKWFWQDIVTPRAWHAHLPEREEINEEIKKRFLVKLFPTNDEPPIAANETDFEIFELWKSAKKSERAAKAEVDRIANLALNRLGNADAVIAPDGKKLWSKVCKKAYIVPEHEVKPSVYVQINLTRKRAEIYEAENV